MNTRTFTRRIHAAREAVWNTMLGDETYRIWCAPFSEGSHFVGSWNEGSTIHFLAPNGEGMVALVETSRLHEYLSLRHYGWIKDGVVDTESESVRTWAPSYENYTFADTDDGGTELTVTVDEFAGMEEFMETTWPRALDVLAELCERPSRH